MSWFSKREDGWSNVLSNLGTAFDKRERSTIRQPGQFSREQLSAMYRSDDVCATLVDLPAREMTRKWLDFQTDDDKEGDVKSAVIDALDGLDALNAKRAFFDALRWARLYGGSAIIVGVNDGQDPVLPVNLDGIKSVDFLTVLDRYDVQPWSYYQDPYAKKYGEVELWQIQQTFSAGNTPTSIAPLRLVHESRVIRFDGIRLTPRDMQRNSGWGDSVFMKVYDTIRDYGMFWSMLTYLAQDSSQSVFRMKNLKEKLAGQGGKALIEQRMQMVEMSRSVARAILLDAGTGMAGDNGESFERQMVQWSGLHEVIDRFSQRLAQAMRMPVTLMMGQSPAGLAATGDSDVRWWYDNVSCDQEDVLKPGVMKLLQMLLNAETGPTKGQEPKKWSVTFHSLWQMTDSEKADVRLKTSQADALDIQNGVLDPSEVANSRFGGHEYSTSTQLDQAARDKMEEAADAQHEASVAGAQAATELAKNPPDPAASDKKAGDDAPANLRT